MNKISKYIINNKEDFETLLKNKQKLYKFIIDNYNSKTLTINIPEIYSTIKINKNKKILNSILSDFIKSEEYEYAAKTKKILNNG